ncbi:adenosylcobinamide-GDP ribazoletransferase [Nocardia mangyaensis]|uniref:Adenosylcobinamide-GDP ribazoletransferase n=1 Tax=Nocardia mangyaensis TaxID=2213200 RepID=A0A1J0VPT5_9NOCA|nr:adenosylcobinamide-GDP ribazoletransferase [Nocardia mangyaensis]APE34053.1 adenosylcobinamide-GDP ribazoletransferase [Nocardia mangyaensis]
MNGVRLAVSWLTVVPVAGPATVDRQIAGRAITGAPLIGVALGGIAAGAMWLFDQAGLTTLLTGLLTVGLLALLTRGMHLDGLADTVDGLGGYGPPARAREIMKSGGAGPFGVAALVFAVAIQAVAFATLAEQQRWFALVLAVAAGRVAVVLACRPGVTAAPDAGFGALVAGTQSRAAVAIWPTIAIAGSVAVVPSARWLGPIVVVAALALALLITRHCVRRFEGLSGDVLGALVEITVALAAVGFTLRG